MVEAEEVDKKQGYIERIRSLREII